MTDHMTSTEIRVLAYLRVCYASWMRRGDPLDRRDVRLMAYLLTGQTTPHYTVHRNDR